MEASKQGGKMTQNLEIDSKEEWQNQAYSVQGIRATNGIGQYMAASTLQK